MTDLSSDSVPVTSGAFLIGGRLLGSSTMATAINSCARTSSITCRVAWSRPCEFAAQGPVSWMQAGSDVGDHRAGQTNTAEPHAGDERNYPSGARPDPVRDGRDLHAALRTVPEGRCLSI